MFGSGGARSLFQTSTSPPIPFLLQQNEKNCRELIKLLTQALCHYQDEEITAAKETKKNTLNNHQNIHLMGYVTRKASKIKVLSALYPILLMTRDRIKKKMRKKKLEKRKVSNPTSAFTIYDENNASSSPSSSSSSSPVVIASSSSTAFFHSSSSFSLEGESDSEDGDEMMNESSLDVHLGDDTEDEHFVVVNGAEEEVSQEVLNLMQTIGDDDDEEDEIDQMLEDEDDMQNNSIDFDNDEEDVVDMRDQQQIEFESRAMAAVEHRNVEHLDMLLDSSEDEDEDEDEDEEVGGGNTSLSELFMGGQLNAEDSEDEDDDEESNFPLGDPSRRNRRNHMVGGPSLNEFMGGVVDDEINPSEEPSSSSEYRGFGSDDANPASSSFGASLFDSIFRARGHMNSGGISCFN